MLSELHLHWGGNSYKGRQYRSYCLAKPYRKNGKNRKLPVIKLGKLSDEEADRWKMLLEAIKKPGAFVTTMDDLATTKHYAYLDVAAVNAIWDYWNLDKLFIGSDKREVPIATVARILTINRCIIPLAKSRISGWFQKTSLPWLLDINPSQLYPTRIFRELPVIESHKNRICDYLFQRFRKSFPGSMKSVFYDLSSTTFSGSKCVLMKYGHCKEGFKNHIVLALVVSSEGLPFYWEVLPGGTADSKTINWLLGCLKEKFQISRVTVVFDRGMVSDDNLKLLEQEGIKYISAMDKNQIESITEINFKKFSYFSSDKIREQAENLDGFAKVNQDTYYREIKMEGKRRYILCFNPQLFKDQRKAREQAVKGFNSIVELINEELREAKNTRQYQASYDKFTKAAVKAKLSSFITIELEEISIEIEQKDGSKRNIRSYRGSFTLNEANKQEAARLDGFWLLVTNHTEKMGGKFLLSSREALKPYRDKIVIEAAFRDIKSFVEVNPVYVWTEAHVKAHYTVCVLAYLIDRTLTLRLHENKGEVTEDIVAHEKFYAELAECSIDCIFVKNTQQSGYGLTQPTHKQKELLRRTELEKLLKCEKILRKINNSCK